MIQFFDELKRRHVYKVAVTYAVVAWVLIQIATQVFPFFDVPTSAVRLIVLLLLLGLPVAAGVAWAFEIHRRGSGARDESTSINRSSSASFETCP
jgi:hypothetical protein